MTAPIAITLGAKGRSSVKEELNRTAADVRGFHRQVESGSKSAAKSAKDLTQAFRGVNIAAQALPTNLTAIAAGLSMIKQHIGGVNLAAAAVLGLGAATVLALGAMVTSAVQFDKSMRNVNSLTGLTEQGLAALEKQVISLSTRLPQSANELAEGLYNIASSGYTGAKGITVLTAAATAASAGLTTTEVAARAITSVLQSYGRGVEDAADVSDVLFQTVNLGVISFEELAGNLGDVVGIAATAKIGIDEVGSAIATMTLSGLNGALATNSLVNLLQKTIQPSAALKDELKELGYESGAQALKVDGLRGVMDKLRKATGGNITELTKLYPDLQAARGALALMTNNGANYAKVAKQIEDVDARRGSTQRVLNEQMKSASSQLQLIKNRLEAVAISGGVKVLPVFISLLGILNQLGTQAGRGVVEAAHKLEPAWRSLAEIGSNLFEIAQNLWEILGPLAIALAKLGAVNAVIALTALAQALASITGFLADHPHLVAALAVAWGIKFAQGVLVASAAMRTLAGSLAISATVSSLTGGLAALEVALRSNVVQARLFSLGIAGLVAYGIVDVIDSFNKTRDAGKATAAAVKQVMDELETQPNLQGLDNARKKLNELGSGLPDRPRGAITDDQGTVVSRRPEDQEYQRSLDAITGAQEEVAKKTAVFRENLKLLQTQTGMTAAGVQKLADVAGLDLTQSWQEVSRALAGYRATSNTAASSMEQQLIKAMTDLADSSGDAGEKVKALDAALKALMGGQLGVNEATRQWLGGMKELTDQLEKVQKETKGHHNTLNLNTEAGRANSAAIDGQAKSLAELVVAQAQNGASATVLNKTWDNGVAALRRVMAQAGFTKAEIDTYTESLGLVPGNVSTIVNAAGAGASAAEVKRLRDEIDKLRSKTVNVTTEFFYKGREVGGPKPGMTVANAYGGIMESYGGGGTRLPKQATIAHNGANLIQWAEPGTGGEAFIPLAADRRGRSTGILSTVADMFGMRLTKMAAGGLTKAEILDKRYQTLADQASLKRLLAPVAMEVSFSLSGQVSSLLSTAETVARNRAEYTARRSPNPYDTADDFYKKPNMSLKDYSKAFQGQLAVATRWRNELAKIARLAGTDVAHQLEEMGEQGVDLVHKMATGTTTAMRQVAAQLRKLGPDSSAALRDFAYSLDTGTKAAVDFQKNLLTLIGKGKTQLAAQLASMGVEQGGAIAAQAVKLDAAHLIELESKVKKGQTATDATVMQALQLAGILAGSGGKLGITGLANASGLGVADVFGLLERQKNIFSTLGSSMRQVQIDLALIAAGKPISGMRHGGIIVPDGANAIRFGEPGTGGEAYIPLGANNRGRSRAIWSAAGRAMGMGGGVHISPGAIQVSVTVPPGVGEETAVRIARGAAQQALQSLTRDLRAGVR